MVWWKAVSNTATWGVSGITFSQASMPMRLAGLWRGPRGMHSRMASFTASVTSTEAENLVPPCSTRWPTAPISTMERMAPFSGSCRALSIISVAWTWFSIITPLTS